ncbi:unnamed protein product, partial [Mesorhabditis spiculigera]
MDIRRFDIYRKIPKDLTQPTTAGAVISIICVGFITFMLFNDLMAYIRIDVKDEIIVDDPGREGKIDVRINISFPYMECKYLGVDIQDENRLHEVGLPTTRRGFRLAMGEAAFSKVNLKLIRSPEISTSPLIRQPRSRKTQMSGHVIIFIEYCPLSVYQDISGDVANSYQYTYGHRNFLHHHHTGHRSRPSGSNTNYNQLRSGQWEYRQSFYTFLTSVCAVVGGTFTVAGIIDSTFFTIHENDCLWQQLGKLT